MQNQPIRAPPSQLAVEQVCPHGKRLPAFAIGSVRISQIASSEVVLSSVIMNAIARPPRLAGRGAHE